LVELIIWEIERSGVMSDKLWAVGYAPLRDAPGAGHKYLDIPTHALVDNTGEQVETMYGGQNTLWLKVTYRGKTGWAYAGFFEDYEEHYPIAEVEIENQTPETDDLAQYFYYEGDEKNNMCGQLSVAWILGIPVMQILDRWKVGSPPFYARIFGGKADRGTSADDLDNLLDLYGIETPCLRFGNGLTDPLLERPLVTPRRMEKMLETHQLIASVHIDTISGNLRGSGALHWVVVDRIVADGVNRGFMELYNPAPNRVQLYSWDEFIKSAGSPYGLWVPRQVPRQVRNVFLTV
jgi:hypothetical protein